MKLKKGSIALLTLAGSVAGGVIYWRKKKARK